ncbi:MAG: transcriptional repressor [Candidatus Marinimicrobia bacterium]|nr:transcriptional repressor [Candidatus Neomarinimicrobiota bacterium]MBL7023351.1 transcriptional repressor [Candidatus Neomarinimicrobiota bacterium]MBL7109310.1 transcriptional repressor [Candidatus Neomarinimicrobiota bacterium]
MRYSKQREEILNAVRGVTTHPTAVDVLNLVKPKIPNISLGTVYRNLGVLTNENQLLSLDINGILHYDGNVNDHQHFYCTQCNELYDLFFGISNYISSHKNEIEHKVNGAFLLLTGICNKCSNKE